ncbi:MAG: hypothetical protein M3Y87_32710 [Myxococcota bacterium]|nr:hypothetical protein [Myxococcota bacterium]
MGFWQDASPLVKGAIVVGGLLIAYFLIAMVAGLPPYGSQIGDEVQQERGIQQP